MSIQGNELLRAILSERGLIRKTRWLSINLPPQHVEPTMPIVRHIKADQDVYFLMTSFEFIYARNANSRNVPVIITRNTPTKIKITTSASELEHTALPYPIAANVISPLTAPTENFSYILLSPGERLALTIYPFASEDNVAYAATFAGIEYRTASGRM